MFDEVGSLKVKCIFSIVIINIRIIALNQYGRYALYKFPKPSLSSL